MGKSSKIRDQLQEDLEAYKILSERRRPFNGWLRTIREALGMSGKQLAKRIGVQQPRIPEMEKAEMQGSLSLKSMQRAAEAMDCVFVYAVLPKTDLETTLGRQARRAADTTLKGVSHTMQLEEQGLAKLEETKQMEAKVNEWIKDPPRWLWDK